MADDELHGDLRAATTMLAADNARMCDIIMAADVLAKAAAMKLRTGHGLIAIKNALEAYLIVRQGQ